MLLRASLLVLLAYQFHILRNLTPLYFVFLAFCLSVFFCFVSIHRRSIRFDPLILVVGLGWIYASTMSIISSDIYGDSLVGMFRFWSTVPVLIVALVLSKNPIKIPMVLLSLFFSLAVFSFAWQYVFGAITWFAEASERAGGERFASLVGSLTSYGVMVGVPALATLIYFKRGVGMLLFVLLALGALMSLQKAALANIVIAFLFAVWIGAVPVRIFFLSVAVGVVSLFVLLVFDPQEGVAGVVARQLIGALTSESELSGDVGFLDSITDRLTALPLEALAFFGYDSLLGGAGVFGGSGVLGYPDIPMAHNGLIEIILIFGFISGGALCISLVYLFVISVVQLSRRRKVIRCELGFLYSAYVIWFVNYLFSGGGLFHPVGASIFWLVVFRIRALLQENSRAREYGRRLSVAYLA